MAMSTEKRLARMLAASATQLKSIDLILAGEKPAPDTQQQPMLLRLSDAAKILNISRTSLWRLINTGKLRRIELSAGMPRIARAEIDRFIGEAL